MTKLPEFHSRAKERQYTRVITKNYITLVDLLAKEISVLRKKLYEAENILQAVSNHGPEHGIVEKGIACGFCDMGDSGYSGNGQGFHDDECATKNAQIWLKKALAEADQIEKEIGEIK